MATTRLYLDLRGRAKDGKGSVLITLFHNSSTTSFKTGIRIHPSCWSNSKIIKLPGAAVLNASLQEQKSKIDRDIAVLSLEDGFARMTASEVKSAISGDVTNRQKGHLISSLFEEYISNSNLKQGTKEIYDIALKKIILFSGKNIKIEDVGLRWLKNFDSYLAKTQCLNGRAIYHRCFRAICNYARHIGIQFSYPYEGFQIKSEPTIKRSVSVEKLRELYYFPTSEKNSMYRDYFFLMFFLIGINAKDLFLAKKSQVIDGRLEYIREKTGKKYSIKIEPEAAALLKKYESKGDYLLEAMDHCKHYKSFAREMNDALKTIGNFKEEMIPDPEDLFGECRLERVTEPVIPGITSYFSRHTWATLAYDIGIQMDTISQALGHSFGNRTTLIYVKPDQKKVDVANRKVIDHFFGK